jgi:hypothetical protein
MQKNYHTAKFAYASAWFLLCGHSSHLCNSLYECVAIYFAAQWISYVMVHNLRLFFG